MERTKSAVASFSATAQEANKTVWEGVYTEQQAKRGQQTYLEKCAPCHLDTLQGDGIAPALVGSDFLSRWSDLTLGQIFGTIQTSMPQDDPGSLSPETYVDVISYLLKMNETPPGDMQLPADADKLNQILIRREPAQR